MNQNIPFNSFKDFCFVIFGNICLEIWLLFKVIIRLGKLGESLVTIIDVLLQELVSKLKRRFEKDYPAVGAADLILKLIGVKVV